MCAIFGLLDYEGNLTAVQRLRIIKAVGTAAEVRGTDAAGIAFFQRDKLCIQKAPKPAHKMKYRIPSEVRVIMGHTRLTTQGSASQNQNNHPFPGKAGNKAFALAHNGVLHNDFELRQQNDLPATNIETDSYIAVQLIEQQEEVTFNSLRRMAEAVDGSFTFTVLDQDNSLYFIKGDNPLTIYHYPEPGLYLYASTEGILLTALKTLRMGQLEPQVIQPKPGEILRIDRKGNQSCSEFAMMQDPYSGWQQPWETVNAGWWSQLSYRDSQQQYIQDLKSVACCYGYSPEEVDILLAEGYTPEDVEEMLCCYDLSNY